MKAIRLGLLSLALAGCTAAADSPRNEPSIARLDRFDDALRDLQQHLKNCPNPAIHATAFAKAWDIPMTTLQRYIPDGVNWQKGTIEP